MRLLFLPVAVFVFVALDISHDNGQNLRWMSASLKAIAQEMRWR
jgi:hypothetical protein